MARRSRRRTATTSRRSSSSAANLAFGRQAADAERWLEKPVIAVNTATYWHALRTAGIADAVHGYGSLLERH